MSDIVVMFLPDVACSEAFTVLRQLGEPVLEQELNLCCAHAQTESGGNISLQLLAFRTQLLEAVEELHIRRVKLCYSSVALQFIHFILISPTKALPASWRCVILFTYSGKHVTNLHKKRII